MAREISQLFIKKNTVLVLGCSGVGKTQLVQTLADLNPAIIDYRSRTRDKSISILRPDENIYRVIDLPGEDLDLSIRNDAIEEHGKDLDLIINVVSYGYHEYTYGRKDAITSKQKVSENFLQSNRKREISAVSQWSESLGGGGRRYRLLTVISKADLWWHTEPEVTAHYESGRYSEALGSAESLRPAVTPHCSVIKRFYDAAPVSGTFDERLRLQLHSDLLRVLAELTGGQAQ